MSNKRFYLALLCAAFIGEARAQLFVDTSYTIQQMVDGFFANAPVQISNLSFSGQGGQLAFFEGSQSNIGLNAGLLITTGEAHVAVGPNNSGSASMGYGVGGNNSFLAYFSPTAPLFDAAIISFDLIPETDTLCFRYVFGSEEYSEYVGSVFNDIFCFMVSGPGLPNPTPFGVNIASIPGSDQPVTINNLNGQNFSQYYIDNAGGSTVQFDGFTIPLWAKVAVQPGETYQVKIGISDVSDAIFDSGVFISIESLGGDSTLATLPDFIPFIDQDNLSVQFQNQSMWATSYLWDFGDGSTSDQKHPQHTYAQPGEYQVKLRASNWCSSEMLTQTVAVGSVSAGDLPAEEVFGLWPNPAVGPITLDLHRNANARVRVFDSAGRLAIDALMRDGERMDLSAYGPGLYLVQVISEGKAYHQKVAVR